MGSTRNSRFGAETLDGPAADAAPAADDKPTDTEGKPIPDYAAMQIPADVASAAGLRNGQSRLEINRAVHKVMQAREAQANQG